MKLLIVTQAVDRNNSALGFFHQWIEEFSKHCEQVLVICLSEGDHALPNNVHVYSLGKEIRTRSRILYGLRFLSLIWKLRNAYDSVFVHMNPEYIVLGGIIWRMWRKKIVLWYSHRQVNIKLHLGILLANCVATAAPESLRIKNKKVRVIGHGVDVKTFASERDGVLHDPVALVSVGRITPIKKIDLLFDSLSIMVKDGIRAHLTLIGEPVTASDQKYKKRLITQAKTLGIEEHISFLGPVSYADMPNTYKKYDISVNLAPTGGVDKAVLESMASGLPTFVANKAFIPLLEEDASLLCFDSTAEDLKKHIQIILNMSKEERVMLSDRLKKRVYDHADLSLTLTKILKLFV